MTMKNMTKRGWVRMRDLTTAVLTINLLLLGVAWSEESETLDALLARIDKVSDKSSGLGSKEQAYIKKLLKHEQDAIPHLVKLLSHSDMEVAVIAAATLGDCVRIDEKYLPEIIKGLDRGVGWLPRALGKIESDQAAQEAVKRYVKASTSPDNQEAYSVRLQGARALPHILETATANNGRDERIYYLLGQAIGEMGKAEQKQAALALMKILKGDQASIKLLQSILEIVRNLEKAGLIIEKDLIDLSKTQPELKEGVDLALIGIRSEQAGRIYASMLKSNPDVLLLRDMSETGKPARAAGVEVIKLLDHAEWELRRSAARTLGFIGYEEAVPKLMKLLSDPSDVIVNWIAAQSLGRLHAQLAEDVLQSAAEKHWHPSVRKEAARALTHIGSKKPYKSDYHSENFPLEFFDYQNFSIERTEPQTDLPKRKSDLEKLYKENSAIKKLFYKRSSGGYEASDEEKQTQVPDVALKVQNGWLVGSSRGEWGGELVFVGNKGERHFLLNQNIENIYTLGKKRIALVGLAHLGGNYGEVYELIQGKDSKWKARLWRGLPGAPHSSSKTSPDEIFISTVGGGNIVLSEDGTFRMAIDK